MVVVKPRTDALASKSCSYSVRDRGHCVDVCVLPSMEMQFLNQLHPVGEISMMLVSRHLSVVCAFTYQIRCV